MPSDRNTDFLVIGAGIVGLATAWRLAHQYPDAKLRVLEKESAPAAHQSGRNSGVLHSGIYYKPGSLKAITCREGKAAMEAFCREQEIPFEVCGKVIVALDEQEEGRLKAIQERGDENGVASTWIDGQQLRELEPECAGIRALHVPSSGIVDYPAVCRTLVQRLRERGHEVVFDCGVDAINSDKHELKVTAGTEEYRAGYLISCAGLHSDRLARLAGLEPPAKIVPFRGEYYELTRASRSLVKNLIYPVPDPKFPFLGVHFTRMIGGEVECGPNAVLALAREGYTWGTINLRDLAESLAYSGFRKLALAHWKMGLGEIHRSLSKAAFVKALKRLVPAIESRHLTPCRAGVRAQALTKDGKMIDDFLWVTGPRMLHVCNAPSPAATASLAIGQQIVERVVEEL